jgi:thiol-disulfide isomerase/thioredoxin
MNIGRRDVLGVLAAAVAGLGAAAARAQGDPWFPITGDNGKPVANMRLPVELTSEIETLPGVVWTGSATPGVTLVEFFDYNCPYCRKAAPDIHALVRDTPDLRVGLVNNPILSPRSADAAKVELALLKLNGPGATYEFHRRLFERRGTIDRWAEGAGGFRGGRRAAGGAGAGGRRRGGPGRPRRADALGSFARLFGDALLHDRGRRRVRLSGIGSAQADACLGQPVRPDRLLEVLPSLAPCRVQRPLSAVASQPKR